MQNLTTNIPVTAAVANGKKWEVKYYNDADQLNPPCLIVGINLYDHTTAAGDILWTPCP